MRHTDPIALATEPGDEVYAVKRTNSISGEEYVRVGVRTYGADVIVLDLIYTQAVELMTDLCPVVDDMGGVVSDYPGIAMPERAS